MRLFIALKLEDEYFLSLQKQLCYFKGTFPKDFHLTLKFLGEVEDDSAKENLRDISSKAFTLEAEQFGAFPNMKHAAVLWLGLKENASLNALKQKIDLALKDFKDDHSFYPHITLARVKYVSDKDKFAEMLSKAIAEKKSFFVDKFILFKAELTAAGHVYSVVEEYNLDK